MFRRILFILVLTALGVALFFNPNFKTISAGIAILLFGIIMLEEGFKSFAKGPLQKILKQATNKLYKSIPIGAAVTALIQSSSLVSVITISFLSAGLIEFSSALGLIFGANIGTTATAWLVAGFGLKVKISSLAMPMLIFGIIFTFQRSNTFKGIGHVLAGLGFFFLGIYYMKEGFDVFKGYLDLTEYAVSGFLGVFVYCVLGIIITTILQSSSASLALILTALSAGQIEYENALALAIGANIGTTITAILGSLSSNVSGKRLAIAHLIFNSVTGAVALLFIYPLAEVIDYLADLLGIAGRDYVLKLALFHTIFNFIGVVIMLPFVKLLVKGLIRFLRDKENRDIDEPKFLNDSILNFPTSTLSALLKESKYLFENAIFEIVTHALNVHREDIKSTVKVKNVIRQSKKEFEIDVNDLYYKKVKTIYGKIIKYATKAQSALSLSEVHNRHISEIKIANRLMVEIIREIEDIRKNMSIYLYSDNEHIRKEYNKFRKKLVKVLRVIYLFRTQEDKKGFYSKLLKLKTESNRAIHHSNSSINKLIREDLVTSKMASSLINDNDNVNKVIQKMITISELLYGEIDTLLENSE